MNNCQDSTLEKKEFIFNNYNNLKYEINVNNWLNRPLETNVGVISKTNEDVVEELFNRTLDLLEKNNCVIYNLNSFKDDLIRFLYKYSYGK